MASVNDLDRSASRNAAAAEENWKRMRRLEEEDEEEARKKAAEAPDWRNLSHTVG